jgi:hypothetical protein
VLRAVSGPVVVCLEVAEQVWFGMIDGDAGSGKLSSFGR